ncbi:MAG: hypothetical protein LBN36_01750 [Clostridiales Family XIII bacterium]|nr:hypothetical protein [Clostridiales Family XIII bacterium]
MLEYKLKIVEFDREDSSVRDFLRLPGKLYKKNFATQNISVERALLSGEHILLKYFKIHKFVAYYQRRTVARWILTEYPACNGLFIGFFECADPKGCEDDIAKGIFEYIESYAAENRFTMLAGPLDCSFWIGYRMKLNNFDRAPYFGETYQRDYYPELFQKNGFRVAELYETHGFRIREMKNDVFGDYKRKFEARQQEFLQSGYTIRKSSKQTLRTDLESIYDMVSVLYNKFPFYHGIEKADFIANFLPLQKIADLSMIRIAFYQYAPVGFIIGLPDHGNIQSRRHGLTLADYVRVLRNRRRARRYVMLYMGVLPAHQGLGKAIMNDIYDDIAEKNADIIGAFNKEGRKANEYGKGFMDTRYEYGMFVKQVG